MAYKIVCTCGMILSVSEDMAGSSLSCDCGRTVRVPSPSESPEQAITNAGPSLAPFLVLPDETPPGPNPSAEIIRPTQISLRTDWGTQTPVMAALTSDAIWIQDTWQLHAIPLSRIAQTWRNRKTLTLTLGPEPAGERLTLAFASAAEGRHWCDELESRPPQTVLVAPPVGQRQPEGVALVRRAPKAPYVPLGRVGFTGPTRWAADRGAQLRAGILGADAIIDVHRERCPEVGWGARHVSGLAVRVEDADARQRLRLKWYFEEVGALVNRMLLLLVILAALLFVGAVFCASLSSLEAPTGETLPEALASAGLGVGLLFAWPLVVLALLWVLRWPQLLRIAGLAVLAVTTGRGLTVWLAHFLAVRTTGATLAESRMWILADPVDWAFIIVGVVMWVRAWRLARRARQMLPQEVQAVSTARKAWSRGLLVMTGAYALLFLGWVGMGRYQTSAYVLQPGADPRREHEALLAWKEGVAQADKGDLDAAERSFQRALRLWEELTARRPAPSVYRMNLAITLYNLGWLREQRGRTAEAEPYFARAVELADGLSGDPQVNEEFKRTMDYARRALRDGKSSRQLDENDQTAVRKYEEAQVKAQKGELEAERLYREAIALWEEVLPQADNADYRKDAIARLAVAHLRLGDLLQQLGKPAEAEASLKKAIDYGEKAVALDPERLLFKHNLGVARQLLEGLREQGLLDEINKLCQAERFADAINRFVQSIEEQEEQVRLDKDHDAAVRRLAYRLDRFAWFLAHCPDARARDAKAAVKHARRATELQPDVVDYWYTLGMVQYRSDDWRGSLASLEKLKAKEGAFNASDWLLVAMNRHYLKQREEARTAYRKALDCIADQQRQAEDNALLRFQFEMMRPAIEALRREAEKLVEGKDPASEGVG